MDKDTKYQISKHQASARNAKTRKLELIAVRTLLITLGLSNTFTYWLLTHAQNRVNGGHDEMKFSGFSTHVSKKYEEGKEA